MSELEEIQKRYRRRSDRNIVMKGKTLYYEEMIRSERENLLKILLKNELHTKKELKILEIGAGTGGNVPLYHSMGLLDHQIVLNELLEERLHSIYSSYPDIRVIPGDAMKIDNSEKFDLIFQFTVFTSILDTQFRQKLSHKMLELLKPDGLIVWYDFIVNNPGNKDVRGVSRREVRNLFKGCRIRFYPVTLAPPVGRRIGKLYKIINGLFPFLRTHVLALIQKS